MPYLIEMFIVVPLIFPILFRGNNGFHSLTLNLFNNRMAIITPIRQQGLRLHSSN